jgi:hypothetical protein
MPLKKSSRKILLRIAVAMVPLAILFSGLVYAKLYGFKRALSELVNSKTDGMYTLNIGRSSIDILALTFTLDDVKIIRSPHAPSKGILGVTIPYMQLKFGSIASMSMVKQFDIKKLIIDEPIIEIDAQQQQRSSAVRISTSNLSYQVVKLYPAIESLLGRFDIESLSIRKATVGMKNVSRTSTSVRLNLVDLLVEHWNIQKLTTESQIQLKVGAQALVFPKASLNFSGIEFNFRQHHLQFSDFNFVSLDTVSQSRVEVSGKSLLLQRLDYKDLYENQRYAIKRATIDQPHVIAEFKLKKDTTHIKDRDLLTRILKQAIGECSIDSTVVRDARIHIVVQKDKDSVKIDLPHVNVNVYAFKVIRDSSAFQVGGLEVGLDRTAIALRRNLSFKCNTILFDKYRDLTLTDVVLYDSASRKNIAQCGKLKLKYFNLLDFAFDKKFQADELSIEDADVNLTPERIKRKGSGKNVDDRIDNVNVRLLSFKNVTVRYADADRALRVNNLSLTVNNLKTRTTGDWEYAVSDIRFGNAYIRNTSGTLVSKMKGVDFDGRLLRAIEIDVQKDSLHLHAKQIMALKEGDEPLQKNYKHWKAIHFNSLEVTGRLPAHSGKKADRESKDNLFETIEQLSVGNAVINLHRDKRYIVCSGKDLEIEKMVADNGKVKLDSIRGQLSDVRVQLKTLAIHAKHMAMNYPARVHMVNLQIRKSNLEISVPALDLNNVVRDEDFWSVRKLQASKLEISKDDKVYFNSDGVMMNDAEIAKDEPPSIKRLEVYNPVLILPEASTKQKKSDHERTSSFAIVHQFVIHPGLVKWKDNQQLTFGKLEGDTRNGIFRCASLKTETEKSTIQVYDIALKNNKVNIDSVHIHPRREWIYTNTVENDLIDARFQGIILHNFSINDVIEYRLLKNADISVDRFSFDIKRDKRMPDPPMIEKPVTLEGLLKLPAAVTINRVDLKNGRIQYTETSEKTGEDGVVIFENIAANLKVGKTHSEPPLVMVATARLYNEGSLHVTYETLDSSSFKLNVRLKDVNLTALNRIVVPLQAIHIKSGYLKKFDLQLTADAEQASGASVISYSNLHLEIRKPGDSEKKRWGNEVLTFLADGILKNSKENATTIINQPRVKYKAIFNYWVKSAMQGAVGGVLRGKHKKIKA